MFYINVWLTVKNSDDVETVRGLLTQAAGLSQAEPGCMRFEVYQSESEPTKFLLSEHWAQKSDWELHRTGKAYMEVYAPQVLPLVERQGHICKKVM